MRKFGRLLFAILVFPAIIHCDGFKLAIRGFRDFVKGCEKCN